MSTYDNTNTGALFKNDKGDNQSRPDYRGELNADGKDYKVSAWINTAKNGSKYMKLKIEPKQDAQPMDAHNTAKANAYQPQAVEDDPWA